MGSGQDGLVQRECPTFRYVSVRGRKTIIDPFRVYVGFQPDGNTEADLEVSIGWKGKEARVVFGTTVILSKDFEQEIQLPPMEEVFEDWDHPAEFVLEVVLTLSVDDGEPDVRTETLAGLLPDPVKYGEALLQRLIQGYDDNGMETQNMRRELGNFAKLMPGGMYEKCVRLLNLVMWRSQARSAYNQMQESSLHGADDVARQSALEEAMKRFIIVADMAPDSPLVNQALAELNRIIFEFTALELAERVMEEVDPLGTGEVDKDVLYRWMVGLSQLRESLPDNAYARIVAVAQQAWVQAGGELPEGDESDD